MSEPVFDTGTIALSRYVGPAEEGPDRRRWQLTVMGEGGAAWASLDRSGLAWIAEAISREDRNAI